MELEAAPDAAAKAAAEAYRLFGTDSEAEAVSSPPLTVAPRADGWPPRPRYDDVEYGPRVRSVDVSKTPKADWTGLSQIYTMPAIRLAKLLIDYGFITDSRGQICPTCADRPLADVLPHSRRSRKSART